MHSSALIHVVRFAPHQDLRQSIMAFAKAGSIKAGVIVSCVGSLEQFNIRFANQKDGTKSKGYFEIVSLTGTFSEQACHLHISISDEFGKTTGGHLLDENLIYTTAEIALAELPDLVFERRVDETYGQYELSIKKQGRRDE